MQQILGRYIVGPSVRTCQGYPNLHPPHQKGKGNALVYGVCNMKKCFFATNSLDKNIFSSSALPTCFDLVT